jgi:hypothetical protein
MTVIAACIKDRSVWIASDSHGSDDYLKHDFGSKIILVNQAYYVGFSASYRIADLIRECKDFPARIDTVEDIRLFRDKLRELALADGCVDKAETHSTLSHPISVIIASASGLHVIESDYQLHSFTKEKSYYSVGSGSMTAIGALYLAAELGTNGQTAVQQAVLSAMKHARGCGGTVYSANILIKE